MSRIKRRLGERRDDGKLYAGSNYGYQSPESYQQLKKQGKFKAGSQQLDRIAQSLSRIIPEPVKQYAAGVQRTAAKTAEEDRRIREQHPVGRIQNRLQSKPSATERVLQGTSDKLNVDRRIVDTTAAVAQAAIEAKAGLDTLRVLPKAIAKGNAPVIRQGGAIRARSVGAQGNPNSRPVIRVEPPMRGRTDGLTGDEVRRRLARNAKTPPSHSRPATPKTGGTQGIPEVEARVARDIKPTQRGNYVLRGQYNDTRIDGSKPRTAGIGFHSGGQNYDHKDFIAMAHRTPTSVQMRRSLNAPEVNDPFEYRKQIVNGKLTLTPTEDIFRGDAVRRRYAALGEVDSNNKLRVVNSNPGETTSTHRIRSATQRRRSQNAAAAAKRAENKSDVASIPAYEPKGGFAAKEGRPNKDIGLWLGAKKPTVPKRIDERLRRREWSALQREVADNNAEIWYDDMGQIYRGKEPDFYIEDTPRAELGSGFAGGSDRDFRAHLAMQSLELAQQQNPPYRAKRLQADSKMPKYFKSSEGQRRQHAAWNADTNERRRAEDIAFRQSDLFESIEDRPTHWHDHFSYTDRNGKFVKVNDDSLSSKLKDGVTNDQVKRAFREYDEYYRLRSISNRIRQRTAVIKQHKGLKNFDSIKTDSTLKADSQHILDTPSNRNKQQGTQSRFSRVRAEQTAESLAAKEARNSADAAKNDLRRLNDGKLGVKTLPGVDPITVSEAQKLIAAEETYFGKIIGKFNANDNLANIKIVDTRGKPGRNRAEVLAAEKQVISQLLVRFDGNAAAVREEISKNYNTYLERVLERASSPTSPIKWHDRFTATDPNTGTVAPTDVIPEKSRIKDRLKKNSPFTESEKRKRRELQNNDQLIEELQKIKGDRSSPKLDELNQMFADLLQQNGSRVDGTRRRVGAKGRPTGANSKFDVENFEYKDQNAAGIKLNRRIRDRLRTLDYEEYFEELYPRSKYPSDWTGSEVANQRNIDFANDYPEMARLRGGQLKTDNRPGKNSVKNQFQEGDGRRNKPVSRVRESLQRHPIPGRGVTLIGDRANPGRSIFTGDVRVRPTGINDPQIVDLIKNPNRNPVSPEQFINAEKTAGSNRLKPAQFDTNRTVPGNRTVPSHRTVLDQPKATLDQPKPGDRIRSRVRRTGRRDSRRELKLNFWKRNAKAGATHSRQSGKLQQQQVNTEVKQDRIRRQLKRNRK